MTAEITRHRLHDLDKGAAGLDVSMGWDWWQRSRGDLSVSTEELSRLLPIMQVVVVKPPAMTPYLCIGQQTAAAQIYGEDWARNAVGETDLPDPELDGAINAAYHEIAYLREPAFHEISTTVSPLGKTPYRIKYRRLLVPCQLRTGKTLVACFTEFTQPVAELDIPYPLASPTLANSRH